MANLTLNRSLSELQREVDRLFDDFFPVRGDGNRNVWTPDVDVWETDESYYFAFDLPGLDKNEVDITYQDGMLQVSGERKWAQDETNRYHRLERPYGHFFRSIRLEQDAKTDEITAHFENGVLTVQVPKMEEVRPRRIEIS